MKFRMWLGRMLAGRNGVDALGRALLWVYFAFAVSGLFFRPLHLGAILAAVWMFFRIFSRNIYKRQQENQAYLRFAGRIKNWFKLQKNKVRDRKTHRYRQCPYCKATLRLPNKKGKHTVCCPKCRKDFSVKI